MTLARANAKAGMKVLYLCVENLEQIPLRLAAIEAMLPLDWYLKPYKCTADQLRLVRASKDLLVLRYHVD